MRGLVVHSETSILNRLKNF